MRIRLLKTASLKNNKERRIHDNFSAAIGIVITASHNPIEDNGVKLIDPFGEMLAEDWETHATTLANAPEEGIADVLRAIVSKYEIDTAQTPLIFVGRDTRPSSGGFQEAVENGVKVLEGDIRDFGITSTPVLHFVVASHNTNGKYGTPTTEGYLDKISSSFVRLRSRIGGGSTATKGNYESSILFDGANGVGATVMNDFLPRLGGKLGVEMFNVGEGQLNHMCGADYVKTNQCWPKGVREKKGTRCVSVDGDADRVMYSYIDEDGSYHLLDGDKIAILIAEYLKSLSEKAGLNLKLGLVQTAYANGASTQYIGTKLGVPVACSKTGVKHLHHAALKFDIGVYFEANGHGTVLFSDNAKALIQKAKDSNAAAETLFDVMNLINETVGDAISDLLLVETILLSNGWSARDWDEAYADFPNKLLKVSVKDRGVISTTDAERICTSPSGLQETIDNLVSKYPKGRAFVRPSGTEDIVRVYAETAAKRDTELLAYEVASAVFEQAAGVGEKPTCPSNL